LPAYGEVPAEAALGGLAQNDFIFAKFFEYGWAFAAKLMKVFFECGNESGDGAEAVVCGVPLWRRKAGKQFRVAGAFFDEQKHGVFVGGKEFKQWTYAEAERELFDGVFVTGKVPAVDEDVEAGVFALNDDVHGSRH